MLDSALTDITAIFLSVALSVSIFGFIAAAVAPKDNLVPLFVMLLGVSTIGAVSGIAGGSSRVGVVGDIVPAALALLGAVAVYLFGVNQSRGLVASFCAGAFALSLGVGYAAGAGIRTPADYFEASHDFCRDVFSNADILNNDEASERALRMFGTPCIAYFSKMFDVNASMSDVNASSGASFQRDMANGLDDALMIIEGRRQ